MFPLDLDDDDLIDETDESDEPRDYELDLRTGKLTGRMVTGLDAIKQWIYLALSTERYYYTQHSWDYGSELHTLIGKTVDPEYIESEAARMIEEALLVNKHITDIDDLTCSIDRDVLTVSFTAITDYGEVAINV